MSHSPADGINYPAKVRFLTRPSTPGTRGLFCPRGYVDSPEWALCEADLMIPVTYGYARVSKTDDATDLETSEGGGGDAWCRT